MSRAVPTNAQRMGALKRLLEGNNIDIRHLFTSEILGSQMDTYEFTRASYKLNVSVHNIYFIVLENGKEICNDFQMSKVNECIRNNMRVQESVFSHHMETLCKKVGCGSFFVLTEMKNDGTGQYELFVNEKVLNINMSSTVLSVSCDGRNISEEKDDHKTISNILNFLDS